MKKIIYALIISLFLISNNVYASATTYPRTEDNLGVESWVRLDDETIRNILNTPKVNENEKIYDFANLLSDEEETSIYNNLTTAISKINMDIIVVTISENNKYSVTEYADDFYNFNNFGKNKSRDGILFLIDMDNRQTWFSTTGKGIIYFDDYRIDSLDENVNNYLVNAKYYDGIINFIKETENYYDEGIPSSNIDYEIDSEGNVVKKKEINWPITLIGALIVSAITVWVLISKHKMIKPAIYANEYLNKNNIVLYQPIDKFLTTHTAIVRINRSSGKGGSGGFGSSIHRSSGGSFNGGGGGRHF